VEQVLLPKIHGLKVAEGNTLTITPRAKTNPLLEAF
jgi:hypothetical protein